METVVLIILVYAVHAILEYVEFFNKHLYHQESVATRWDGCTSVQRYLVTFTVHVGMYEKYPLSGTYIYIMLEIGFCAH